MSTTTPDRQSISVDRYHGTGNDFAIVDADEPVTARRDFAKRVCDRTDGFGVDGVLFLALEPEYRPPRVVMTLVQPDGSTAPMCGNGARCAAAWAMARTGTDTVMIDTQAGSRRAERIDAETDSDCRSESPVAVEMGRASFVPKTVPVRADEPVVGRPVDDLGIDVCESGRGNAGDGHADVRLTAVDTGVPHAVAFVDDVSAVALDRLGPAIRHADAFPRGTNVTVASRDRSGDGDDRGPVFRQRTYERGVEGETESCGTGAVAIAVAAEQTGRIVAAESVTVRPPGGDLRVDVDDRGRAILAGPVVYESATEIAIPEAR